MINQHNKAKSPFALARKLSALAIIGAIAFTLASCGGAPSSKAGSDAGSKAASGDAGAPQAQGMQYYGKISSIAGNEIEFDLAKLPGQDEAPPEPPKDGEMAAVTITPATPSGEATGDGGGAANRVEVEYTGETKSFIVPAGVPVSDQAGGEKQLSDLKKGTMLSINTDKDGNVTQVIYLA